MRHWGRSEVKLSDESSLLHDMFIKFIVNVVAMFGMALLMYCTIYVHLFGELVRVCHMWVPCPVWTSVVCRCLSCVCYYVVACPVWTVSPVCVTVWVPCPVWTSKVCRCLSCVCYYVGALSCVDICPVWLPVLC